MRACYRVGENSVILLYLLTQSYCWFIHDDEKKIAKSKSESANSGIETSEMFKRLFDIMEKFGERMNNVENQI